MSFDPEEGPYFKRISAIRGGGGLLAPPPWLSPEDQREFQRRLANDIRMSHLRQPEDFYITDKETGMVDSKMGPPYRMPIPMDFEGKNCPYCGRDVGKQALQWGQEYDCTECEQISIATKGTYTDSIGTREWLFLETLNPPEEG